MLRPVCSLFKLSKLPYFAHIAVAVFRLCRILFRLLFLPISAAQPHLWRTLLCRTRQTLFFYICLQRMFSNLLGTISRCRRRERSDIHCKKYLVRFQTNIGPLSQQAYLQDSCCAPYVKRFTEIDFKSAQVWSRSRPRALNRVRPVAN